MKTFVLSTTLGAATASTLGGPCAASTGASAGVGWHFAGPSTYGDRGDTTGMTSAGAAQMAAKGANSTWFLGSVNGGVWRTTTLGHAKPTWENVLDGQPVTCSSISALHVSASDARRVYAGCGGSTSSEQGSDWNVLNSGDWSGVMASEDGGNTWAMVPDFPSNYYVTDIVEVPDGGNGGAALLVSTQSQLYDREDGGIWRRRGGGIASASPWEKVDATPTFTLSALPSGELLATHARTAQRAVSVSADSGATFAPYGKLPWASGATPFYTCATTLGDGRLVVAGLTRLSAFPNATDSQFFITRAAAGAHQPTWEKFEQPTRMDEDSMPKDRMAVLADPELKDLMYVAGNAGALAWRVNMTSGVWTKMWDDDVLDGSEPHGDCRNYAWDAAGTGDGDGSSSSSSSGSGPRLVLVSDGGVFAREQPRTAGGRWVSLNGDYASMELLSAHYDWRGRRYIAGAQDNSAQVTPPNSTAADVAIGFVGGDGTVTAVDSDADPSRLFGTTQFIGVGTIDIDPSRRRLRERDGDDDDDCGGLCFVQGDKYINVPIDKYFPNPACFPFFVQPYVLNRFDKTKLVFWTNASGVGDARPSGFWQFDLPYTVQRAADIAPPSPVLLDLPADALFLDFIAGGMTGGVEDPALIVGVSNTHLYIRSSNTGGSAMVKRALPVAFALPITMQYDEQQGGARILGPVTHGRTVSLAVSRADSNVLAVTGWPSVADNKGDEVVYVSTDGGKSWTDVTANLKAASGVVGKVRPGGLLFVELPSGGRALLVGSSSGPLVSFVGDGALSATRWSRLGSCAEFPIVLTADLSYEPHTDRVVAATFGRGIYSLVGATKVLEGIQAIRRSS